MANAVSRLLSWPLIGIVKLYRVAISPWLGVNCRFQPTCAEYTIEALREYGVFKGTWLATKRIGRCHPWGGSGYDPVPGTDKDDAEPDVKKVRKRLNRERAKVLNHAYGFASRGNRDGGLDHIYDCLVKDPDPDTAWPWFLDQMLGWEDTHPALLFAQQYVGRLLEHNDKVGAVKLMLRCRLVNPDFRPLAADLPAAIAAAEGCRNMELVQALRG